MRTIISRYLIREITVPFFFILFILTFVLLMGRILQLMDLTVNKGVSIIVIGELIGYLTPSFMVITIPVSLLISILIAFGRLSGDNEITVMKSSGISLFQLLPPVFVPVVVTFLVTALFSLYLVPEANFSTKRLLFEIARQKASIGIREKAFNDDFEGLVLYAEHIPVQGNYMEGIFISDSRSANEPITIIAKKGYLISNPDAMTVTLRLENGSSHFVDGELKTYRKMDFSSYDLNLDLSTPPTAAGGAPMKERKEMNLAELTRAMGDSSLAEARRRELMIEFHRKFALPVSCIVFGILGIPLGIVKQRSGKSRGFVIGLSTVMVYYILELGGGALGEAGKIAPALAAWTPNVLLGAAGIWLLTRAARERAMAPFMRRRA